MFARSPGLQRRHAVALLVGAILGSVLAIGGASPAQAHAVLIGSTPEDGATLDQAPPDLVLRFDSSVEVSPARVTLVDGAGHEVTLGSITALDGPGASSAFALEVALPSLAHDRYLVRWQTITSSDLHRVSGSLTFGVGVDAVAAAAAVPGDRALGAPGETFTRGWLLIGLALLLGATLISLTITGTAPPDDRARRRLRRLAAVGGGLGAAAAAGWGLDVTIAASAAPSAEFIRSWTGLLVGVLVAYALARRRLLATDAHTQRLLASAVVVCAVVALTCLSGLGHGGSESPDGIPGSVLAALHVTATLCWAGGLIAVAAVALPEIRTGGSPWAGTLLRRFTYIAIPALTLSVVSGLLLTSALIPALRGLTDTSYGRALLLKIAVVVAAASIGAVTGLLARGRADSRAAGTRLVAEGALLVVVLAVAAALAGGQPPSDAQWLPSPTQVLTNGTISGEAADLEISLTLGPARPGANFVTVGVYDTRRPAPARIDSVQVRVGTQPPAVAPAKEPGRWVMPTTAITTSGTWPIQVIVHRSGLPDASTTFTWEVAPRPGTQLGGVAISGLVSALAWLVLLAASGLAVCALVLAHRARRHRSVPPEAQLSNAAAAESPLAATGAAGRRHES